MSILCPCCRQGELPEGAIVDGYVKTTYAKGTWYKAECPICRQKQIVNVDVQVQTCCDCYQSYTVLKP